MRAFGQTACQPRISAHREKPILCFEGRLTNSGVSRSPAEQANPDGDGSRIGGLPGTHLETTCTESSRNPMGVSKNRGALM